MRIEKVTVVVGGTIQVGNDQNTIREVSLEARLEPGDNLEHCHTALTTRAATLLANDVAVVVDRQLDHDWLEKVINNYEAAARSNVISHHVEDSPSFPFLALLSPAVAATLVDNVVGLYINSTDNGDEEGSPDEDETADDISFVNEPDDQFTEEEIIQALDELANDGFVASS